MHMRSVCLLLAAGAVFAQTDGHPAFEAAFVKANTTGSGSSSTNGTKGQVVMVNQPLKRLVERAYNVRPFQVTGPEWMENVRFDITAKYPENTRSSDRPAMLRTLLEDRFKLATHMETKEMPGYTLVVAKSGLKVTPVDSSAGSGTSSNDSNNVATLKVTSIQMAELADYLARRLDAAVVDRTGATGAYTFELHWSLDDPSAGAAARGAAEFAALQEAIGTVGLHLQATKVPVEIVVVDHIERVPTEN
jgi:uncharacterized protein (TIGR03435 family)